MTLAERRKQKGVTQKALAELLGGIDRSSIAKWETGATTPSIPMLKKLTTIYGCTIDDLLQAEEES